MWHGWSSIKYWSLFIFCYNFYQSGYYTYLIMIALVTGSSFDWKLGYLIYVARVVQTLGFVKRNSFTKTELNMINRGCYEHCFTCIRCIAIWGF